MKQSDILYFKDVELSDDTEVDDYQYGAVADMYNAAEVADFIPGVSEE